MTSLLQNAFLIMMSYSLLALQIVKIHLYPGTNGLKNKQLLVTTHTMLNHENKDTVDLKIRYFDKKIRS